MAAIVEPTTRMEGSSLEDWGELAVPEGWEPVASLCRAARADIRARVRATVDTVRREVPEYRAGSVPDDDLETSVAEHFDAVLVGIAERRGPTGDEVDALSRLGCRRAHQDVPLDCLLQAYHLGYRDLWRRLLHDAEDHDVAHLLLQAATTMWEWTHRVTDGIGRAHADTIRRRELRAASKRHRFVELVSAGDVLSDEVLTLCRSLGFDPDGTFSAHVVRTGWIDGLPVDRLRADLARDRGVHQPVAHGPRLIVVSQGGDPSALQHRLRRLLPDAPVGAGLARPGLDGARLSIGDASLAASVDAEEGVADFALVWPWAVLDGEAERLAPLLHHGRAVAAEHPSLGRTIECYAANGFSIAAAAEPLHVHANTVAYRLERWRQLTGWDARTFEGLVRSMASLRLGRAQGAPAVVEDGLHSPAGPPRDDELATQP